MPSGWAVIGDVQVLPGCCLLLPDPVVPSLNDLSAAERASYLHDMVRLGDAMLKVTGASRINYEILGNSEPELHYIDRILHGAKPADLPAEQLMRYYFSVNLKTATTLGFTIPPSLLLRADDVIQ